MDADTSVATLFCVPLATTHRLISAAVSLRPSEGCRQERSALVFPAVSPPFDCHLHTIRPSFRLRKAVLVPPEVSIMPSFAHQWRAPNGGPRCAPGESSVHPAQMGLPAVPTPIRTLAILPCPSGGVSIPPGESPRIAASIQVGLPYPSDGFPAPFRRGDTPSVALLSASFQPSATATPRSECSLNRIRLLAAQKAPMFRIGSFPLPIAFFLPFPPLLSIYRNPRICNPTFYVL